MLPDLTLVLFRPRWDEVAETLDHIAAVSDEFRLLHILLSGRNEDLERLNLDLANKGLAERVRTIHRWDNLGFASGHNLLLRRAFASGAPCCLVLNPDIEITPGSLVELLARASRHLDRNLVAPSLQSEWDGRAVIDSQGIRWTSDARHFDRHQGEPWPPVEQGDQSVSGVTGACLLVSQAVHDELVAKTGCFFDDAFLAYREDAELGIRAGIVGVGSIILVMDGFSHERHVRGSTRGRSLPDLLGVRNRFLLRWKLGRDRPGRPPIAWVRDAMVLVAALTIERRSADGLRSAFAIRRATRYSRRRYLASRLGKQS